MPYEILHILGTAQHESTSMARMVAALARELDPERFHFNAWFLGGQGLLVDMLEQAGMQASTLDWSRGTRDPFGAWSFWRRLHSREFKIVHIHFGGRSVRGLARAGTRAKIIVHVHGRVIEPLGLSLVTYSGLGADAVVATSQAVARQVVDAPARVIYPGVAVRQRNPPALGPRAATETIIGAAGRLVRLKGLDALLHAVATLRGEFPGLRVEIAGSGPERARLEQLRDQLQLQSCVEFLGWINDLASVLPRWDIFVMPSLEEGFGISALDAMAEGLPVVATRVGGVPELVENGKTGWLTAPRDIEALTSRIRLLLNSPEQRLAMGAVARARVQDHFSLAQMCENFGKLYEELLSADKHYHLHG